MEPVFYVHLGTNKKCSDNQDVLIFQISLYDKAPFGTITKCICRCPHFQVSTVHKTIKHSIKPFNNIYIRTSYKISNICIS